MREKNRFLLFLCALIPGCGQMYQGYMKRGFSLTLGFSAILTVAAFLSIGPLAFFLPAVWLYSFFDCYNLCTRLREESAQEDAYLFGLSEMDSRQITALLRRRHSIIGWVLVALGVYLLYDTFMRRLMRIVSEIPGLDWAYGVVIYDVPRLVITVLIILLGLWFIRGPKKAPADEIPIFVPPAEEPQDSACADSAPCGDVCAEEEVTQRDESL